MTYRELLKLYKQGKLEDVSPAEVRDGLRALNERLVKMHQ